MKVNLAELKKQNLRCGVFQYFGDLIDSEQGNALIGSELEKRVVLAPELSGVLTKSSFILGQPVRKFEEEFAARTDTKYAIGVGNGTDALRLALIAAGVKQGDPVLVPDYTFVATATAVTSIGAIPIFVDVDIDTMTLSPGALTVLEQSHPDLLEKTKAIIPVHLFGHPADMDPIMTFARDHGLKVIEDCAQAQDTQYQGRPVGSIGDIGCFSFFPAKTLGCLGDGGTIVTNSDEFAAQAYRLRTHGRSPQADGLGYDYEIPGTNSRLDGFQAAVLSLKLPHLNAMVQDRRETASLYNTALREFVEVPVIRPDCRHTFSVYTIQTERRDELQRYLKGREIATVIYYPKPLHAERIFERGVSQPRGMSYPVSTTLCSRVLSLPVHSELTAEERDYVIRSVREFFGA